MVWLALPALLFQATAQITRAELSHFGFMAAFSGAATLTFVASFLLDRRRSAHPLADRSIEALDASYGNTGFVGIPLCLVTFGQAGLPPAILASLFVTCVMFAGAIVLIEIDLQTEASRTRMLAKVGRSLARNPLLVSPVAGFAFAATGLGLPMPVLHFTTLLGGAATPCALVTIGLFLAQSRVGGLRSGTVVRLVALKLLLQPALTALLVYGVFRMPRLWAHAAIILGALPTGSGPFMLAKLHDREAAVTSQTILVSTVLSVVTISVLVAWLA